MNRGCNRIGETGVERHCVDWADDVVPLPAPAGRQRQPFECRGAGEPGRRQRPSKATRHGGQALLDSRGVQARAGLMIRSQVYPLAPTSTIIGRRSPSNVPDLDLTNLDPDRTVSRRHARLELRGSRATVEDFSSTNGTYVNDKRMPVGVRWRLRAGDRLRLGRHEATYLGRASVVGA